ncbi:MAG: FliG C-terminal domain-containing protein [Mariniblastus sp.]
MLTYTTEERLAMLLSVLGTEASQAAFKSMNPTRANYVKKLIAEFESDPPSKEEIEFVVEDFNSYFTFAMDTLSPQLLEATSKAETNKGSSSSPQSNAKDQTTYFTHVEPSGSSATDLNRLDPFQIAMTLTNDRPKTIALVLQNLNAPLAALVLQNLAEDVQRESIVFLSQPSNVPQKIVDQILASTFEKANAITQREVEVVQSEILAELLRSLPKDIRKSMIERLTEENEELVKEIRSKLYVFEDVLRLGDRDIQKILGEIETDILIVGLQKAEEAIFKKLLDNLSKRARQTIAEEMQYKTEVSAEEIDEARQVLIDTIGRLDEAGEVTLA